MVSRYLIAELLAQGHQVTAFARAPERVSQDHENLSHFEGNALRAADVDAAVAGHDAVVVALDTGMNRKSRIRSAGTLNVINAMQQHGVRRLVVQSTLGTFESWANPNFW